MAARLRHAGVILIDGSSLTVARAGPPLKPPLAAASITLDPISPGLDCSSRRITVEQGGRHAPPRARSSLCASSSWSRYSRDTRPTRRAVGPPFPPSPRPPFPPSLLPPFPPPRARSGMLCGRHVVLDTVRTGYRADGIPCCTGPCGIRCCMDTRMGGRAVRETTPCGICLRLT